MGNLNKVMIIGNLTKDPDLRYTPSGAAVCNLDLALNRKYKSKDEELKSEVTYVSVTAWGRIGEICSEYLCKGRSVFIEGRLEQQSWENEAGEKRTKLKIIASNVQFLGGKKDSGESVEKADNPRDTGSDKIDPMPGMADDKIPF